MSEKKILPAACASSDDWERLQKLLLHEEEQTLENLYEQVDQSDFSLADWINALLGFDQWLNEQKITARPVETMIGYIHCCTLTMPDTLAPPDLAQLTIEMLEQHGFDAVDDALAGN